MTRAGIVVCDIGGCYRTIKPGTPFCLNHQLKTEQDEVAEQQRLAEVFEARRWHRDDKAYFRLVNDVLEEGKTVKKPDGV